MTVVVRGIIDRASSKGYLKSTGYSEVCHKFSLTYLLSYQEHLLAGVYPLHKINTALSSKQHQMEIGKNGFKKCHHMIIRSI